MNIGANGLVVNEFGEVLLIQRDDTRTWALPGGSLEVGELPTVGVAREVEEETGLKVLPVRLVGLDYWTGQRDGYLVFLFRCLVRGGGLTPSEESPKVGFYPMNGLPSPMFGMHRERLGSGYRHSGGPPYWTRQRLSRRVLLWLRLAGPFVYGVKDLRRRWRGLPRYAGPSPWGVGAFVVIRDGEGRVLWVRRQDYDVWNLPGGGCEAGEAPWEAAVREVREETGLRVRLTNLAGVYVKPDRNQMVFNFTGEVVGGRLELGAEAAEFGRFRPGEEPANSLPKQVERVADVARGLGQTVFKVQAGRPGLEVLGVMRDT